MERQTYLVTGGCGFVGSAVVHEIVEHRPAATVVVLDNLCNGRREFLPECERVVLQEADLRDQQAVHSVMEETRPQVVLHLAALHFIPYCNAHPAETLQVNVVGTQHLLEASRSFPPAKLVVASSAAVYPIRTDANKEESPIGPTDIYGLTKSINEQQIELYSRQTPTRCAAARLFNVFGPRETNPHVIPEIIKQVKAGQIMLSLGNVKPKRDYVHVTDVARALLAIVDQSSHRLRTYNVGTGQEHSVEEIVAALTRLSGIPLEIRTDADRVRPADRMHLLCDLQRIQVELGWRPRYNLETGLAELWRHEGRPSATAAPALV